MALEMCERISSEIETNKQIEMKVFFDMYVCLCVGVRLGNETD